MLMNKLGETYPERTFNKKWVKQKAIAIITSLLDCDEPSSVTGASDGHKATVQVVCGGDRARYTRAVGLQRLASQVDLVEQLHFASTR
jgi:hypothetical protein